jgi:hypothetical protein
MLSDTPVILILYRPHPCQKVQSHIISMLTGHPYLSYCLFLLSTEMIIKPDAFLHPNVTLNLLKLDNPISMAFLCLWSHGDMKVGFKPSEGHTAFIFGAVITKHWYPPASLHGVTTRKTNVDIFNDVRRWNLDSPISATAVHTGVYIQPSPIDVLPRSLPHSRVGPDVTSWTWRPIRLKSRYQNEYESNGGRGIKIQFWISFSILTILKLLIPLNVFHSDGQWTHALRCSCVSLPGQRNERRAPWEGGGGRGEGGVDGRRTQYQGFTRWNCFVLKVCDTQRRIVSAVDTAL